VKALSEPKSKARYYSGAFAGEPEELDISIAFYAQSVDSKAISCQIATAQVKDLGLSRCVRKWLSKSNTATDRQNSTENDRGLTWPNSLSCTAFYHDDSGVQEEMQASN